MLVLRFTREEQKEAGGQRISMERRKYLRAVTDVFVQFCEKSAGRPNQQPHEGLVENCSAKGMYISTGHPSPRGSLITLKFCESATKALIPGQVCATVRWVRYLTDPKGMGVEFLEFEGVDERDFKEWITSLPERAAV